MVTVVGETTGSYLPMIGLICIYHIAPNTYVMQFYGNVDNLQGFKCFYEGWFIVGNVFVALF